VVTWNEFAEEEPELASACRAMMYQYGVGLAFLATVRPDGGPRLHPMCPVIAESGLFAFLIPSPKRGDLHRDGRYAMHSFPADENEDAFSLTGTAEFVDEDGLRRALQTQFLQERELGEPPERFDEQELFAFRIERCLHTVTTGHGDPAPRHRIWRAP
jgi:Pyridoxamine 5'-phosphate oxidase